MSEDKKQEIIDYLASLEGKGVDTVVNISKAVGIKRRECSKLLVEMEYAGVVQPGGVTAGVAGYGLKKK